MKEIITSSQKEQHSSPRVSHIESEYSYTQSFSPNTTSMKHKLHPNYLIKEEQTIPISEVRDIISRTMQVNQDVVEK
jgi:hypothetical protein